MDNLYAAFLTYNASILHPLIAATETFEIFHGAEYFCAKQSISFRLECPVINRLRFLDLTMGPRKYLLRRSKRHLDCAEPDRILRFFKITKNIFHYIISPDC
jgi:hypothetical protein